MLYIGMVVILDIGDLFSIYLGNKQDVGKCLVLFVLVNDYDVDVVFIGLQYESYEMYGDIVVVNFCFGGSGLQLWFLEGFEIVGVD